MIHTAYLFVQGIGMLLWFIGLCGLIEELHSGVTASRGPLPEVRHVLEPRKYWIRIGMSALGLVALSVLLWWSLNVDEVVSS